MRNRARIRDEAWDTGHASWARRPAEVRCRRFLAVPPVPAQVIRLHVAWVFDRRDDAGLPGPEPDEAMRIFEARLVAALEGARVGTLSHVVTHSGVREWIFYVADLVVASERIEPVLAAAGSAPLTLMCDGDPDWLAHRVVLDGLA